MIRRAWRTRLGRAAVLCACVFAAKCAIASPSPLEPLRETSFLEPKALERISRVPAGEFPFEAVVLRISAAAGVALTGRGGDTARAAAALERIADGVRGALGPAPGPRAAVEALTRVVFREERFVYDPVPGDPDNFLLHKVLEKRRGNCLGLSAVILAVGERLGMPLHGVYVPGHCFVRYDGGGARINIETAAEGGEIPDREYAAAHGLGPARPYLVTLSEKEMTGVFLKSLGAAHARRGMDAEAVKIYRAAAAFAPLLPDVHFNAGVSLQRMGRLDEAIASYRLALSLDPDLAAARNNLGIALHKKGRTADALAEASRAVELDPCNPSSRGNLAAAYCAGGRTEEAIREYLRALTFAPRDPRLRAGLVRAYYAGGKMREAAEACDLAEELGCRFDPGMKAALAPYRQAAPGRPSGGPAAVRAR